MKVHHLPLYLFLLIIQYFAGYSYANDANYYACNNGYSNCNQSLLTEQQKQTVQQSSLSRNYYACNNGYSNCNYSLLSDEQKQGIQQKIANGTNPTASGGLACAENGSCYGDISNITGLPKTTHVNGYFRRDGTYVRGHYRSRR